MTLDDLLIYGDWLEENDINNTVYKLFLNCLSIKLRKSNDYRNKKEIFDGGGLKPGIILPSNGNGNGCGYLYEPCFSRWVVYGWANGSGSYATTYLAYGCGFIFGNIYGFPNGNGNSI